MNATRNNHRHQHTYLLDANGRRLINRFCGAYVCNECGDHDGLARCFCGWTASGSGNGYRELVEMGEQIEADY